MGYTAMNALNFIKTKRTQVMPNFGFLSQLKTYEKNHIGNGSQKKWIYLFDIFLWKNSSVLLIIIIYRFIFSNTV